MHYTLRPPVLCLALSVWVLGASGSVCAQAPHATRVAHGDIGGTASTARTTVATPASMVAVRARVGGPDVVRSARRFLGVPYRLGGTTPRAFDCSGFVRYVFALHGIAMPRTAHEQAALGEAPAPGDSLEPGDLLFFWGGTGAQHIAIYVGGDSIIHASSTGHVVRLDRLSGSGARARRSWFNQRLIAVRRILPQDGVWYVPTASPTFSYLTRMHSEW